MNVDRSSLIQVVSLAAASSLLSELFAWLTIFRTPEYHRMMGSLENAQKRLDKKKDAPVAAVKEKQKGKDKRVAMLEKEVEVTNRDLTLFRVRSPVHSCIALACLTLASTVPHR